MHGSRHGVVLVTSGRSCLQRQSHASIGGDFNYDLNYTSSYSMNIFDFLVRTNLTRCDEIMSHTVSHIYYNNSNNRNSHIDYFVTSHSSKLIRFEVTDHIANLYDHLPLLAEFTCVLNENV